MQLFACVIILFICAIFLGLWHSLYTLSAYILSPFLSAILTFCIFYYLILELCRRFTFPGSTWLWRRNIENHYQKTFVLKIRKKILLLKSLIQYIDEGNPIWKDLIPILERREIFKTLNLVLILFGKQVMHKTLTNRQKAIMEQFTQLERALKFTKLVGKISGKTINVWEFLVDEKNQVENLEQSLNFSFEDKKKSEYLLEQCKALDFRLHDIVCEKSGFPGMKRWFFENTFGTIDHVREELENRYKCQHINLKVSGNNTIDCVFILDKIKEVVLGSAPASRDIEDIEMTPIMRENSKRTQASSLKTKSMGPTIIICCPNAGYYEYTCYESQWLDLYLSLGFNVFLWNYRGYGRSTGKPDPQTLRRDGEAIVDYLREEMGIEIIGCHGESIGGLVATHLARWKNLDFLCADRTLESLFRIATVVFGKGLRLFYRILTGWDDRLVLDFLECKCYKIITFDPKDEVIPFLCSLQQGITSRIVQSRIGITHGEPIKPSDKQEYKIYSLSRWILRIKQFIYSIQIERFLNKVDRKLKQDNGTLQKEQLKAFYKALSRVYELFEAFSYLKHSSNVRKHRRMVSVGGLPHPSSPMKLNSSLQAGEQHLNASPTSMPGGDDISVLDVTVPGNIKNEIKQGERISHQSGTSQDFPKTVVDLQVSLIKEPYQKLFDQEAQRDTDLVIFLENVFTSFEIFELGGVQIETIMTMQEDQRFEAFKHFLNSLDIWGSYLPLHHTLKEEMKTISYHHIKALRKIKVLTKRLDHIAKTEKFKDQGNILAPLHKILKDSILEDIELIVSILPILIKNAKIGDEKEYKRYLDNNPEQIELMPRNINEGLSQKLLGDQIDLEKKLRKDYSSTVGHLIPLCCGHNGTLRPLEIEIYEHYIKNAGLI